VAAEEVQVGAEGLLDQPQVVAGGIIEGHGLDGPGEVQRQVEDQPRLGLGLQERKILEQSRQVAPRLRLEPLPRQLIYLAGIGRPLGWRHSPRSLALGLRGFQKERLLREALGDS
jgi:hypothetical protein